MPRETSNVDFNGTDSINVLSLLDFTGQIRAIVRARNGKQ